MIGSDILSYAITRLTLFGSVSLLYCFLTPFPSGFLLVLFQLRFAGYCTFVLVALPRHYTLSVGFAVRVSNYYFCVVIVMFWLFAAFGT